MAKHDYFKQEFDRLAVDGRIGRPDGKPAYAYLRVSSDEQGDEGRSGLPRQLEHVHEKAYQAGYCIEWDRVFADDFTGFELERPELDRLRGEYRSGQRRASVVVMEHLDRLSRNADWHQGFLLDEMKQRGIEPVFWKAFSSRIERVVMGTIAQEGMEQTLQRMADGTRKKAQSGRVTARHTAYGYRFVDDHGNVSDRARKMTHYGIVEDTAAVVRLIYQRVAAGDTLGSIARDLTVAHIPPPKNTQAWRIGLLGLIIRNEVYKGEFIANRTVQTKVDKPNPDGLSTHRVRTNGQRPEHDWIRVPVPPIVDTATWQAANDMLAKNKAMAARNAAKAHPYLLTSLLKCAECGATFRGRTHSPKPYNRLRQATQDYGCPNGCRKPRYLRAAEGQCSQNYVNARLIEPAVWSVVCNALLNPDVLLAALETDLFNDQNAQLEQQIDYLEREIEAKRAEDDKLYRAYVAEVFDETEYRERRALLKAETARLSVEVDRLSPPARDARQDRGAAGRRRAIRRAAAHPRRPPRSPV